MCRWTALLLPRAWRCSGERARSALIQQTNMHNYLRAARAPGCDQASPDSRPLEPFTCTLATLSPRSLRSASHPPRTPKCPGISCSSRPRTRDNSSYCPRSDRTAPIRPGPCRTERWPRGRACSFVASHGNWTRRRALDRTGCRRKLNGDLSPALAPYKGTVPAQVERQFRGGGLKPTADVTRADFRASFAKWSSLGGNA